MSAETYDGKPCAHGHTRRYRSNRKCVACSTRLVKFFELAPGGETARAIGLTEAAYCRRAGFTYWRAVKLDD